MSRRPGRAKMCSWLAGQLYNLGPAMPYNPADIKQMSINARDVDMRKTHLAHIASDLGWHVSADLDRAWQGIQEYEKLPPREVLDEYAPKRVGDHEIGGQS